MTMDIDALVNKYNEASDDVASIAERHGLCPSGAEMGRAGIRAVVKALAPDDDEIAAYNRLSYKVREQLKCECDYLPEDKCIRCSVMDALNCLETRFNDILGGAGEKAAEKTLVERVEEEARKPVAYRPNFPATDPSPEVCEWTLMDKYQWSYRVACAPNPSTTYHPHPKVLAAKRCKNCNRPIAFKEPKP